ncbi:hypothetical protein C0995_007155 [Termitomyces sp. Mi166|nr:hypothetical protein C0995_007155 [Termitomyces sp. Mi166\
MSSEVHDLIDIQHVTEPLETFLELRDSPDHAATRVPAEILAEIFTYSAYKKPISMTGSSPLGLSHVCSQWRITALNTPHLWSTLSVDFERMFPSSSTFHIDDYRRFPEIWFKRAGSRPLTFILHHIDDWSDSRKYTHLLSAVGTTWIASRLTELRLSHRLRKKNELAVILTLPEDSFPALKKLVLELHNHSIPVTAFRNTPLLRSVAFRFGSEKILVQNPYPWQWSQLTRFECTAFLFPDQWCRVLSNLINVCWCSICVTSVEDSTLSASSVTALTHLAFLEIYFSGFYDLGQQPIFRSIRFPALKTYVQTGINLYPRTPAPLTSLALSRLCMRYTWDLMKLLSRCYSLERLAIQAVRPQYSNIYEWKIWDDLREHLPLLPHLNILVTALCIDSQMKDMTLPADAFARIAMSCRNSSLKNVRLFVCGMEERGQELIRLVEDKLHADPDGWKLQKRYLGKKNPANQMHGTRGNSTSESADNSHHLLEYVFVSYHLSIVLSMGSSQSILSPEAAAAIAVVAGAVGFGYSQFGPSGATSNTPTSTEASGKKGKKKKKASVQSSSPSEPSAPSPPTSIVVPFPKVLPGGFDGTMTPEPEAASPEAPKSTKAKKKKKSKLTNSATSKQPDSARLSQTESKGKAPSSTPSPDKAKPTTKDKGKQTTPPSASAISSPEATTRHLNKVQSSVSIDTDGSWTRVESRRNKSGRSVDVTTTSASDADPATGTSSPVAERTDVDLEADVDDDDHFYTRSSNPEQRRPLAERMLPKPRRTGVESMLETPDHATLSRVMRVQPQADERSALGFSWGDYEEAHDADVDGEDDNAGWDVVKSRRPRTTRPSASEPSTSQSQQKKAPETLTKRQRQNAARREAQKVMKEEAEHERRATLARHQRELENERMKEQARGKGGKKVSGGMMAVVSESGKLVWE